MVATSGSPGLSGDGTDFWITGRSWKDHESEDQYGYIQGHGYFDSDFFFAVMGGDSQVYYGWINSDQGPAGTDTYLNHRYYVVWVRRRPGCHDGNGMRTGRIMPMGFVIATSHAT